MGSAMFRKGPGENSRIIVLCMSVMWGQPLFLVNNNNNKKAVTFHNCYNLVSLKFHTLDHFHPHGHVKPVPTQNPIHQGQHGLSTYIQTHIFMSLLQCKSEENVGLDI